MKIKILLAAMVIGIGAIVMTRQDASAQPVAPNPKTGSVNTPEGAEAVVTLERQTWMSATPAAPDLSTGLRSDYTLQGRIVYWGEQWVVLKDGTYENWIARDKILNIRVSR